MVLGEEVATAEEVEVEAVFGILLLGNCLVPVLLLALVLVLLLGPCLTGRD